MLTVKELINLWRTDDLSTGYMHPEIVVAVCEQTSPSSVEMLRMRFYPSKASHEVDPDAMLILEHGFSVWTERGKPVLERAA